MKFLNSNPVNEFEANCPRVKQGSHHGAVSVVLSVLVYNTGFILRLGECSSVCPCIKQGSYYGLVSVIIMSSVVI